MFLRILLGVKLLEMFSVNTRNGRGGLAKNYSIQIPKGFSVKVFKAPTLSNYQYAATPKFDLGYRTHPSSNPWPKPDWSPSDAKKSLPPDHPARSSRVFGGGKAQNRRSYDFDTTIPPLNYPIYPCTSTNSYIYECSPFSKSDTYTESDITTSSPSSCFSTALSNDSTATLQSIAPAPTLMSDAMMDPLPRPLPSARVSFPIQIPALNIPPFSTGGSRMHNATSVPMLRSLTVEPVVRLPGSASLEDELSVSTGTTVHHSATSTYSSVPSATRDEFLVSRGCSPTIVTNTTSLLRTELDDASVSSVNGSSPPGNGVSHPSKFSSYPAIRKTESRQLPHISSTPSTPHETCPPTGPFSTQEISSTSATRGSSPRENLRNISRTGDTLTDSLHFLSESHPTDAYIHTPARRDTGATGRRDVFTASGSHVFASPPLRTPVPKDRVSSGEVNKSIVEDILENRYLPRERNLNNDARLFAPSEIGGLRVASVIPGEPDFASAVMEQAEPPSGRSHLVYPTRTSDGRQNSHISSSAPLGRGQPITTDGGQDPLDLAERGESPPIPRDSQGSDPEKHFVRAEVPDPTTWHPNRPQDRAVPLPVEHLFSATPQSSSLRDASVVRASESYNSTASRGFVDLPEPLQNAQIRNDLDNRTSFNPYSQPTKYNMDYQHGRSHRPTGQNSEERQDFQSLPIPSAPQAALSAVKPPQSKLGDGSGIASRDMYVKSASTGLTARQTAARGTQPRQDVHDRHTSTFVTRPSTHCPQRRDLDERQEFSSLPIPPPSEKRTTYGQVDTTTDKQPPPPPNQSRNLAPGGLQTSRSTLQSSQPPQRFSEGPGNPGLRSTTPAATRCVRWDTNLIAPSPIFPSQRRKGWFNRRGDQLWMNDGSYKPPPVGQEFPPDLDSYPEYGQGWQNEEGVRIDMLHRLIPKVPLRSALKRPRGQR